MPIVRVGGNLVFYAHVPKCAGTAVENFLSERFGALAFLDRRHHIDSGQVGMWSRTSPQHIDVASLNRLFPQSFFWQSFAVVRHPASRLRSSYIYEQLKGRVRVGQSFEGWLKRIPSEIAQNRFSRDNHVRPMNELVPEEATIFRLEDGLEALVTWFDSIEGEARGPRKVPLSNKTVQGKRRGGLVRSALGQVFDPSTPDLTRELCERVYGLFPKDYERFGYGVFDPIEGRE